MSQHVTARASPLEGMPAFDQGRIEDPTFFAVLPDDPFHVQSVRLYALKADGCTMTDGTAALLDDTSARRAARNAAALAVASIVAKGALFLWQLVLNRLLTQADYGIYGTIGGMMVIAATLPEFGMGLIVLRDVAQRRELAGKTLSATLAMQPLLAAVAYGGLILAGALLGYDQAIRGLLPLAGLSLFIDTLGNMVHNQLLAREQMVIPSIISVAHIGALIALAGLALLGGLGLWGLYWATIAAGGLRALAYWITLVRAGVRLAWPLDRAVMGGLLINGAPLMVNSFLGTAHMHVDKIITTATIGEANTALLLAAFVVVAGVVELLSTTVLVAVFPMMSRQHGSGQREAFDFLVEKIAFLTLVVTVPIGVVTSALASPLVAVLFSPQYTRTTDVLAVLIWYGVVTMMANVFAQVLMIQNRQLRLLGIRAGGLVFNVLLALFLLPRLGAPGAAISSVVAEVAVTAILLRHWDTTGEHRRRLGPRVLRLAAAGAIMALAMVGIQAAGAEAATPGSPFLPLVALVVGGAVYLAAVGLLSVIAPDDRGFIRQVLVSLPGGSLVARVWRMA